MLVNWDARRSFHNRALCGTPLRLHLLPFSWCHQSPPFPLPFLAPLRQQMTYYTGYRRIADDPLVARQQAEALLRKLNNKADDEL